MILQTGGAAFGTISIKSSPRCCAMRIASLGLITPSCPESSITLILAARISSFIRTRSDPLMSILLCRYDFFGNFVADFFNKLVYLNRAQIPFFMLAYGNRIASLFFVSNNQHVGNFLGLPVSNFIAYFLTPVVQFDPESQRS